MVIPGEITEIVGRRSSGRMSVVLACLADVTRAGGIAALIDGTDALDVESAARAGVELRRLLWVRCGQVRPQAALRAVDLLARCRGFAVVAWDVGDTPPRLSLTLAFRLKLAARQSGTALLIVSPRRIAGAAATLAVETHGQDTRWEVAATPARSATAAVAFPGMLPAREAAETQRRSDALVIEPLTAPASAAAETRRHGAAREVAPSLPGRLETPEAPGRGPGLSPGEGRPRRPARLAGVRMAVQIVRSRRGPARESVRSWELDA